MKRVPNSKTNLDKAIQRFAGEIRRANELRTLMANAIVAQMIGEGVYGRSITDPCLGWEKTERLILGLADRRR